MKFKPAFFIAFFVCLQFNAFSQNNETKSKDIDIVKVYEKVLEDGYESVQIYQTLANRTYERRQFTDARKWFEKWFELEHNPESMAYLRFARTLEALNETEMAKKYLELYESKKTD